MSQKFRGVIPALITPFTADNHIDVDGFRRNIEFTIQGGVSAIVPCGTTGESATMSAAEHMQVTDIAVEASSVPVIAGTGSNNTAEAIEFTKHAADAGAAAVLVITPYYNKPTQSGLKAHFEKIADSVDVPMILYNVPSRTGVDMSIPTIAELAKHPNIVGIKEATGDMGKATEIISKTRDEDFALLSGDDVATLPLLSIGATGVISVLANILPSKMAQMVAAYEAGNLSAAMQIHYELAPLMKALFIETNPAPIKTAAGLAGHAAGPLRLPLVPLQPLNLEVLTNELKKSGVLK
ncbi:4-hydroxy-tetrahydrodipicolinate synthase [Methanimicrococcus hongohii]|uniref:4-hydroxy-tetrahydrodipicolinate synthase n=1 Tax=Methanimicrococcus hongohii TaxID=3028295 RepID=A0AA96VCI6_9EURY|nr:4-hydroxy-tetrahydrodipicolinate synthase [Methanimicrococcus sp. Hf6]WNY24332.1 4-hydroxy-tetrahydrodipicolinate synthase [Methanimicrococcus sp. Hf6]